MNKSSDDVYGSYSTGKKVVQFQPSYVRCCDSFLARFEFIIHPSKHDFLGGERMTRPGNENTSLYTNITFFRYVPKASSIAQTPLATLNMFQPFSQPAVVESVSTSRCEV